MSTSDVTPPVTFPASPVMFGTDGWRGVPVRVLFIVVLILSTSFPVSHAQALAPTAENLNDALMKSSRMADVEAADGKPFRLKASFATFDYRGQPAGEGTLEEIWLRPGTVRRLITFRGMSLTQIAANGSMRTIDDSFEGSFMERRLVDALLHALPTPAAIGAAALAYRPLKVGTGTLDCALMSPVKERKWTSPATTGSSSAQAASKTAADAAKSAFCMAPATHLLRIVQERFDVVITYNKIVRLGDHAIGEQIAILQNGVQRGTLSVTSFGAAPELTDADFTLPSNGIDLSVDDVELPGTVMAGRIVKKTQPVYPPDAKHQHISGSVVLSARIGPNGLLVELDPVSSPSPLLTESALAAVKQWRYQPYLVDGVPTSVETTITVVYSFTP